MSENVLGQRARIALPKVHWRLLGFWLVVLAQIIAVAATASQTVSFLTFTSVMLGGPCLAYHLLVTTKVRRSRIIASGFLATALAFDLGLYYQQAVTALGWNLLKREMGADVSFAPIRPVETREVQPLYPVTSFTYEPVRDLPVILQRSYVFSPDFFIYDWLLRKPPPPHRTTPADFAGALDNPRWNSLLFTRNYFNLIHSGLPVPVLETLFAVHQPVFQLKHAGVLLPEGVFVDALHRIGAERAERLARGYALLQDDDGTEGVRWASIDQAVRSAVTPVSGHVRLRDFQLNRVRVAADTASGAFLEWSDGYSSSWRAFLDGKPVKLFRAGLDFKAVWIPAGAHEIAFEYRPTLFIVSVWIFILTFVITGVGGCLALAKGGPWKPSSSR